MKSMGKVHTPQKTDNYPERNAAFSIRDFKSYFKKIKLEGFKICYYFIKDLQIKFLSSGDWYYNYSP